MRALIYYFQILRRKLKTLSVVTYRVICLRKRIMVIDQYDHEKSQVLIRFYVLKTGYEGFFVDGVDVIPDYAKTRDDDRFLLFGMLERRLWLPLRAFPETSVLRAELENGDALLTLNKRKYYKNLSLTDINNHFLRKLQKDDPKYGEDDTWLLMDRDTQADDNAEHLYRYLMRHQPDQKIVFVLRRNSHDWDRLEKEGFNLVDYGSAEHETLLLTCSKIVSSQVSPFIFSIENACFPDSRKFVFLQHGVIKHDLSTWLNRVRRIDCFIASAKSEYDALTEDFGRYTFTRKQVVLTGMARHDRLLERKSEAKPIIAIMPGWRKNLLGEIISGHIREYNPRFIESQYARTWQSLLCSKRFSKIASEHGYEIVFFPHANVQPYLNEFSIPGDIKVGSHASNSIQDIFATASILITDFSSIEFEYAYLERPVLYYQFDEEDIFDGSHFYRRGYYDYHKHGFGPIVSKEEKLLDELENILANGSRPSDTHLHRMQSFFEFHDSNNSRRIYEAIVAMDKPMKKDFIDQDILGIYTQYARDAGKKEIYESRLARLEEIEHANQDNP